MGYYTSYSLSVVDQWTEHTNSDLIGHFRNECDSASYALDANGDTSDDTKWYSHQADIEAFSTKHPLTTFLLEGRGDEDDDVWRLYVKNGKSVRQTATLSFPAQEDALKALA